jgi:hypothetical protein
MNGLRTWIVRALRGPAGGVAVTLMLGLVLGGVAIADPGGVPNDHAAHASESASQEPTESPDAPDQESERTAAPAAHTTADCTDAVADVQADLTTLGATTGLPHAIDVVGANCQKNLQAPGLLVALQHLASNFQRHQEHEAAKAAKAAARAGAAHGRSGASHGHAGEHGSPSTGS